MEIISGKINDENYHLFEKVLDTVYDSIPEVKNLVQKVNPVLANKYYVVLKDNQPLARLVHYINTEIKVNDKAISIFGNFESINKSEPVKLLFDTLQNEIKCENLIGPICGSTWYDYRIAIPSYNKPFFTEFFCMPYYQTLLTGVGFRSFSKYRSYTSKNYSYKSATIDHFIDHFSKMNIHVRTINMNDFENELLKIYDASIEGFKNNLLYSGIGKEEFIGKYRQLKQIIDPDFIFLAMEGDDKCVGFGMSLHNLYNKEIKQLVMKSAARLPDNKYKGLGTLFNELSKRTAVEKGYDELIQAFVINDSVSERSFVRANNSTAYREYELLIKSS